MANRLRILLVEDNPGDVYLLQTAVSGLGLDVEIVLASNGAEAMSLLRESRPNGPDAVILDLNLPLKTGREVLDEMRNNPRLRRMPVAILTSSTADEDVALQECKERCRYFVKTSDIRTLEAIVGEIHRFALASTGS